MARARRPRVASLALSALSATASTAFAPLSAADDRPATYQPQDGPGASGTRVALRSGAAVPVGEAFAASGALASTITGIAALRLDLGYRIERHFYVGVAAQHAVVVPNGCPDDTRCSGSNSRFGVMLAYHVLPTRLVDPWLGVGMGFEMLHFSRASGASAVDVSARGLELLDLELGADVRASRAIRLGPVISTSLARYTSISVNDVATSDFETSLHAWVMFGLRGAFDL